MVFGNTGDSSGTGVGFTRNPATGAKEFYGEFLINAQGEDVVAGIRTPRADRRARRSMMPKAYKELRADPPRRSRSTTRTCRTSSSRSRTAKLFMLQTRNGKRTGHGRAEVLASTWCKEKLIDGRPRCMRNPADQLDQLLAPVFDAAEVEEGRRRSPRACRPAPAPRRGQIYFNADRAVAAAEKGKKVLLVRNETSPEDIRGMIAAEGILTARGGMSSHAALVGRQMGKVCVCGAAALEDRLRRRARSRVDGQTFKEGDCLSIDGTAGEGLRAARSTTAPSEIVAGLIDGDEARRRREKFQSFQQLMNWCRQATRMQVRTNADTPEQTANAIAFGADGIGLCRTEHMFFEGDRIDAMREMILADNVDDAEDGAGEAAAVPARRLRRHLQGAARATRRRSASSIRRCTSSCRTTQEQQADLAKKIGVPAETIHAARRAAARVQPDARLPRLPPRHHLSRDHRDAGARHLRGRGRRAEGRHQGQARDHDPAGRLQEGARPAGRDRPSRRRRR